MDLSWHVFVVVHIGIVLQIFVLVLYVVCFM